jgi:vancomycin resistance protein VanJ
MTVRRDHRGWLIAGLSVALAALTVGHRLVPNSPGNVGSFIETFLPWLGVGVLFLLVLAALWRSPVGLAAAGLAAVVWLGTFGQLWLPGKGGGEQRDLRVLTHNVGVSNPDPEGTVRVLLEADADLVALQELSTEAKSRYSELLAQRYPHVVSRGTVALWSKHPLADSSSVDIGLGWTRALRTEVQAPGGTVAVYVAHLASVRVDSDGFSSEQRDETIVDLGMYLGDEQQPRVLLLGDLNGTAYDRSLAPLTAGLQSAQAAGGWGFGFTWPAGFPLARIDHILVKGVTVTDAEVLARTGSDHRPITADLRL